MGDFVDCSVEWYKYCDLKAVEVLKMLYFQWFLCLSCSGYKELEA